MSRHSRLPAGAVVVSLVWCAVALAKHPKNAGPEDPPIKFPLPPPEALSAAQEMKTFRIQPGFQIDLAAAEPLVEDPTQITFDEKGRMWVVEFRGYMHTLEGGGEKEPTGRIKILESTKHDGNFDKATVFLDHLVMPRAVLPLRGGALVAEPPELAFYKEQDGKAAQKTVVTMNYGARGGQPEHMANGLTYGMDNWIYSADYSERVRWMGGKWEVAGDRGRGQWGLTQDNYGRLYFDYNEDLLRCDVLPAEYMIRNPFWPGTSGTNVKIMLDETVWPSHPTPGVNRGYQPNILRDNGTLRACTANCGPCVYRAGLFGPEYQGNVFICEPAGNLVKRVIVGEQEGTLLAQDAYYGDEFLTSTDERFRPVNTCCGPDGALYVVDMYRGVIEHERFLTNYLIKNIEARKLVSPIHRGRIYRITPRGSVARPFIMPSQPDKLIACLAHPDGWVRDTAQRLLVEKHDIDTVDLLIRMASDGPTPVARLHALWTLNGMNQLEMPVALGALSDADPQVRTAAVRLCERFLDPAGGPRILPRLLSVAADRDPNVRVQLLLTLSAVADPQAQAAAASLIESSDGILPALVRDSAISGLRGRELEFLRMILRRPAWESKNPLRSQILSGLARCIILEHRTAAVAALLELAANQAIAQQWRCAALLHGMTELVPGSLRRKPRLIYLDHEPESFAQLLGTRDDAIRKLARKLDQTIAWPGKPGVAPPPKVIPLTAAQQAQFERGRVVYSTICAACHQPSGLGQEGLAPPLVDSEWLLGPPQRPIRIVLAGVAGPIKVSGLQFQLEMPSLGTLSDDDIADVLTYTRREWEHTASPVDPRMVAQIREQTRDRSGSWTETELLKVKETNEPHESSKTSPPRTGPE